MLRRKARLLLHCTALHCNDRIIGLLVVVLGLCLIEALLIADMTKHLAWRLAVGSPGCDGSKAARRALPETAFLGYASGVGGFQSSRTTREREHEQEHAPAPLRGIASHHVVSLTGWPWPPR
jgi:hypothetical protein